MYIEIQFLGYDLLRNDLTLFRRFEARLKPELSRLFEVEESEVECKSFQSHTRSALLRINIKSSQKIRQSEIEDAIKKASNIIESVDVSDNANYIIIRINDILDFSLENYLNEYCLLFYSHLKESKIQSTLNKKNLTEAFGSALDDVINRVYEKNTESAINEIKKLSITNFEGEFKDLIDVYLSESLI